MKAIFLTSPELLTEWWDRAEPALDRVVSKAVHGEFRTADLRKLCDEKRATACVFSEGETVVVAMVFEFILYPKMTTCNIIALGGSSLGEVLDGFFITFKDWCKSMGVTVIEASCSSAMSRLLQRFEFKKTYEVVRVEL